MWYLPPPLGFQGLREDQPLEVYVRHLPHWRQAGGTYFLTFRLADSLPQAKLEELAGMRRKWERRHAHPWSKDVLERLAGEVVERVERWLDQGMGSCVLSDSCFAAFVTEAMHYFDNECYELDAYVAMANHGHAIVRPLLCEEHPLETIVGSWKQFSSKRINACRGGKGELWQDKSYDRIVRDEEHLWRCLQYICRIPRNVNLAPGACPLWVRPDWSPLGWAFEDRVGRAS